jgi:hypothetical protein
MMLCTTAGMAVRDSRRGHRESDPSRNSRPKTYRAERGTTGWPGLKLKVVEK